MITSKDQVARLADSSSVSTRAYTRHFSRPGPRLIPSVAASFRSLYDRDSIWPWKRVEDPNLKVIAKQISSLKVLKTETIEPGFRQWMIRSLRKDKRYLSKSRHVKNIRCPRAQTRFHF